MLIGVPKEIKNNEYRAGLTGASVRELVSHGHQLLVETETGNGIELTDDIYRVAGAEIVATAEEVYTRGEMIVKVKEPQPSECKMLREGQVLFTYLHLAPDPRQTELLLASGVTGIAYETVTDSHGGLPLLTPMSEVAGRMSIQAGAQCLEKSHGGAGLLLGGVPGVAPANVVVVDEVVHYCVANMPGAVARTSTFALNNATLPYAIALADRGCKQALKEHPGLRNGFNVHRGRVTYEAVARDLGYDYQPAGDALGI